MAVVPTTIVITLMEVAAHLPSLAWLDSVEPAMLVKQLPILLLGLGVYPLAMLAAYRISARRFTAVNL